MLFAVKGFAAVSSCDIETTMSSTPNPSTYGQSVTISATVVVVTCLGGGGVVGSNPPLTGTVTFIDGASVLGTSTFDNTGQATINISSLDAGTHPITATYGGQANYTMSSASTINQVVTAATVVPTMNEWGMMLFAVMAGFVAISILRKQKKVV